MPNVVPPLWRRRNRPLLHTWPPRSELTRPTGLVAVSMISPDQACRTSAPSNEELKCSHAAQSAGPIHGTALAGLPI